MSVKTVAAATERVSLWQRAYQRKLLVSDSLIVFFSVFAAQFVRFGLGDHLVGLPQSSRWTIEISYTTLSVLIALLWLAALGVNNARGYHVTGAGFTEFKRLFEAAFSTFGLVAITSLLLQTDFPRGYILVAFPLGLVLLVLSRWTLRKWLHAQRRAGQFLHRAVIIGEVDKAEHVAWEIGREPYNGYKIVGSVTDSRREIHDLLGVVRRPSPGSTDPIIDLIDELDADTLIVVSTNNLSPVELRQLGWAMEERRVEMIVAPALTDIAGPRIHTRPVAGLPLIYIEYPELKGRKYWFKRTFDVVGSALLIALLSPLLLAIALCVKMTSSGPVLFRQTRIGQHGVPYQMLKFRSMVVDADSQLRALLEAQGTADRPLFKVTDDPRITPIGRFLRKYSLDELPQLFNSLMGTMSLVGPRPQVEGEVALYDDAAFRRLMVKPGLTGLWQVSGRSTLSWEDSVRLDLFYVENWSFVGDLVILGRTVRAVLKPEGAY
ncbi:MAG: sugar transferase [Arachnia sp.]